MVPNAPPIPGRDPIAPGARTGVPTVATGGPGGVGGFGGAWPPPGPPGAYPPGAYGSYGPATAPGPGGRPLVDRAPRWLIALAALVVLALIGAGAYMVMKGGKDYPKEWDTRVDSIARWVAQERGLDFEHPVKVNFLTPEEYTEAATGGSDVEVAEDEQEAMDQAEAMLRALGLVSGELDLGEESKTLADSGSLAYYSPDTEEVYVRGTELNPGIRVTLAHELTHVLQDQHFDLDLANDDDGVMRAIAEGDATRIEEAFSADVLTDAERAESEQQQQGSSEDQEAVDSVSPALTAYFAAPYIFGPELLSYLERSGGVERIDEALADPPTGEVLFDPLLYGTDAADDPDPPVEVEAPEGAEVLEEDTVGSLTWYLMLAARLDPKAALAATDGIGGDALVLYRADDRVCARAAASGDTPEDLDQLANALKLWAAMAPEGTATVTTADGRVELESCDPGADAPAIGSLELTVLGLPVSRTQVYNQLREVGADDDQARCAARRIIDELSLEEITGPGSDEISARILDITTSCA